MTQMSSEISSRRTADRLFAAGLLAAGVVLGGTAALLQATDSDNSVSPTHTPSLAQVGAPFREGLYISAEVAGGILVLSAAAVYATGRRPEDSV